MNQPRDLLIRWRNLIRAMAASGAVTLLAAGCSPRAAVSPSDSGTSPSPGSPAGVSHENHGGHGGHGVSANQAMPAALNVVTMPVRPSAGEPVDLSLQILAADKRPVTRFELLHEKLAHLIVVREGLDEFAHLHPDVSEDGSLRIRHTFARAGDYHLFVDYLPGGGAPSLATGRLTVAGENAPAPELVPNIDTAIADGSLRAKVDLQPAKEGTTLRFKITDAEGNPTTNLQPYLGAMGHLVVIKAGSLEYVHAHRGGFVRSASTIVRGLQGVGTVPPPGPRCHVSRCSTH